MNQTRFQWVLLAILVFMICGLGLVLHRQSQLMQELVRDASTRASVPVPVVPTSTPARMPVGQEIARINVTAEAQGEFLPDIQFFQRCVDGRVVTQRSEWDGNQHTFCVGKNQLFVAQRGEETLLDERVVDELKDVPVLFRADVLTHGADRRSDKVLVSYAPEACTTTGDCGVGMRRNHVTYLYSLQTKEVRKLNRFPEIAQHLGIWNESFTKALFYPLTCGGAGCEAVALYGYNLERDQFVENLTQEKAAEMGIESPDVSGIPLPMWSMIEWTSDTTFRAEITDPSGPVRTVQGQF